LLLLLTVAGLSALGVFYLGETIVPVANRERLDIERYEVKKIPRETRANLGRLYFQLGEGKQLYIERFQPVTGEAFGIQLVTTDSGRVAERLEAEKMVWRDRKWWLGGVSVSRFERDGWMTLRRVESKVLDLKGVQPDAFSKIQTAPEELNYGELQGFIERMRIGGGDPRKWEVDLRFKVAMPAAAVIIVLFGAPIAAVRRRSGTGLAFGLALLICFIYFGFTQFGRVMGHNAILTPFLSAWIGNIFFGVLGLGLITVSHKY
jgi:lipopolysaccharide export system permease protein